MKTTKVECECLQCESIFFRKPSEIRKGGGKFCCVRCRWNSQKGKKRAPLSENAKERIRQAQKKLWGKPEYRASKSGKHSYNWKGGISKTSLGYLAQKRENHGRAHKGFVLQHILVVEDFIGRFLNAYETIHHINEIRSDNRPENLYIFSTTNAHSAHHAALKRGDVQRLTSNLQEMRNAVEREIGFH